MASPHPMRVVWTIGSLTAFALVASALLGCLAPRDDPNRPLRLVWFGSADEETAIRSCVASFEEVHPGVAVEVQMVEWGRFNEKIMTMLLGRRPPDVSRMSVQWCPRYESLGALADIRPHFDTESLEDFDPARLVSCRAGEKLFGFPHTSIGLLVFINRDLFRAAGLSAPSSVSEAWAWEEFASDARTLQRVAGVQYGWGVFRGWFPVVPFLYQHGGWLLRDGEPDFANAANVEALTWFVKQHTDGIAPTSSWAAGGDPAETLFIRGDCGMVITGNWRVVSFGRQITDFEWGVAPLPRDVRRATNSGGENLVVFNTDRVEGATQLAAFLTAPEQMEHYCTQSMFLPTRRSLLSRELPYQQRPEAMALFAQQSLDFEPAWAQEQSTPQFAALDSALVRQFELATLGHQTPRESLEALNHEYRQALIP